MKNNILILSLMLGALSLTACQKDGIDNGSEIEQHAITRNFTVDPNSWDEASRSAYEEGAGVKVYGNETISVWYADAQYAPNTSTSNTMKKITAAGSDFNYAFTHNPISGAEAYDYYFLMPATTTNSQQSTGKYPNAYLNTIQTPTADSFDPAQDYLAGKPLFDQQEKLSSTNVSFKRLFAPVKIVLANGGILNDGEKIRFVSFTQSEACTTNNPLVGTFYLRFDGGDKEPDVKSDVYENAAIKSWLSTGYSNNVSAYYPEGLEAAPEGYPVWLIVNPSNRTTGEPTSLSGTLTVSIVTDNRLITKTIELPAPIQFKAGKLNKLTIALNDTCDKHDGQTVLTQDFAAAPGSESGWTFGGSYKFQNGGWYSTKDGNGSITLPNIPGKKIVKIIILPGLYQPNNSTTNTLTLSADATDVGTYNFNVQNMLTGDKNAIDNSGYLTIDVPEAYQLATLKLTKPATDAAATYIRAISVVYESSTAPAATVSVKEATANSLTFGVELNDYATKYYYLCQPAAATAPTAEEVKAAGQESTKTELTADGLDELTEYTLYVVAANETATASNIQSATASTKTSAKDYYEEYVTNGRIEINGITYSKEVWGEAKEFSTDELTVKQVQAGGIIFLTPGTNPFNFTNSTGAIANTNLLKNVVLIGKYSNQQPVINSKRIYCSQENYAFVNLHIKSSDNLFTTDGATDLQTINISGCTLEPTTHLMAVNKLAPKQFILDNSIVRLQGSSGIYIVTSDNLTTDTAESIIISNNVIYTTAEAPTANYLIGAGTAARNLPNVTIDFSHNSIYNLYRNPLLNLYYAKSISMTYNAIYANATVDKRFMTVQADDPAINVGPYIVSNNFATKVSKAWDLHHNNNCKVDVIGENNMFNSEQIPFRKIDAENGYFPIDKSVVTNGAGASYDTKLWKIWE